MSFCGFSDEAALFDATPVENMFIIEYMPDAPDQFVRVYLYLRMIGIHPELCESFEAMTAALHMEKETVEDALAYWEREGLIMRVSDNPRRYELCPLRSERAAEAREDLEYYKYRNFHAELQSLFGAEALDRKELVKAAEWTDELKLTQDAVLFLLKTEIGQKGGKKPEAVFRRADKRALDWKDHDICTLEQARAYVEKGSAVNRLCADLLRRFGLRRAATADELNCVRRWTEEWKLGADEIIEACGKTVSARQPSFGYLDKILEERVSGRGEFYADVQKILKALGSAQQPTPDMLRRYAAWREAGFEAEAALYLAEKCAGNGYTSFDRLEKQIERFGALGLKTLAEVETKLEALAREIEPLLGESGIGGLSDIRLFEIAYEWKRNFEDDMIRAACKHGKSIRDISNMLIDWKNRGLTQPPEDTLPRGRTGGTRFNYDQRSYTDEDFAEGFFYDLSKERSPEEEQT